MKVRTAALTLALAMVVSVAAGAPPALVIDVDSPAAASTVSAGYLPVRVRVLEAPAGLSVSARLRDPDGNEHVLQLRDDGVGDDESAGDGVWCAALTRPVRPGPWKLLFVKAALGGQQLAMTGDRAFTWAPDPARVQPGDALADRMARWALGVQAGLLIMVMALAVALWRRLGSAAPSSPTAVAPRSGGSAGEVLGQIQSQLDELRQQLFAEQSHLHEGRERALTRLRQLAGELIGFKRDIVDPLSDGDGDMPVVQGALENLLTQAFVRPYAPEPGEPFDDLRHRMAEAPRTAGPYVVAEVVEPGYELAVPDESPVTIEPALVRVRSSAGGGAAEP